MIEVNSNSDKKIDITNDLKEEKQNKNVILDVNDLHTYFYTEEGIVKAVDGVSFKIYEDEIMGLVGETGCGKSVTALSIMKLVRPPGKIVSGSINFIGENLIEKDNEEMRNYRGNTMTMIFQDPLNSLNPVFTIGDQISEVILLHQKESLNEKLKIFLKEKEEAKRSYEELKVVVKTLKDDIKRNKNSLQEDELKKLNEELKINEKKLKKLKVILKEKANLKTIALHESEKLLERIGIPDAHDILKRYPHELSGGMRQRVMISMGLACNSKLLICDEPTTALDVTIQAQILDFIQELKSEFHNSILFITHSLGVIYELCDRVAVMYSGRIVEYGYVKEIFNNPLHPYTKGLLSAIPKVIKEDRNKDLETIPGMVPNLIYPPRGCRFHPRCDKAMVICSEEIPKLKKRENGVEVACHYLDLIENHKDVEQIIANNEKYRKLSQEEKDANEF